MINGCFGRVDVLGLLFIGGHDATTKAYGTAGGVVNGKHHPACESVKIVIVVSSDGKSGTH